MTETVRIRTTGSGYRYVEVVDEQGERSAIPAHRVLATAWGDLSSPFFSEDPREIHHETPIPWYNVESNLVALSPAEHRERDPRRAGISAPWDRLDGRIEP